MIDNPVKKISKYGQSVWLDYIRRGMLESGELHRLIEKDGLRGVTVNPSILQKAIAGSHDYDNAIRELAMEGKKAKQIYEILAIEDVRKAADLFLPMYKKSNGKFGFVSLEVSPHLAHNTEGTIAEAHRFWNELNRPNVMIKVPATWEGLPAIESLIEEGINVNVTLLFGLNRYREVVNAYIKGLKPRMLAGKQLHDVNSVASFFLSRIDVLLDPILENKIRHGGSDAPLAANLHGQVAIASARIAYQIYKEIFFQEGFYELADEGARPQRLLWASTSTKNPAYSDVKYVDALIGPDTVNTIPLETLNAYRDHGDPDARLEIGLEESQKILDDLPKIGINLDKSTQQLEDEGVGKFIKSYDHLIKTLDEKCRSIQGTSFERQYFDLGDNQAAFENSLAYLERQDFVDRLWKKDTSLWKEDAGAQEEIRNSLGWLHVAEKMEENLRDIHDFVDQVKSAGIRHVVHLGMGGSSLAPIVMANILKPSREGLRFDVLDTTVPEDILKLERFLPLQETLFIVASKSGTTAETRTLADHFYQRLSRLSRDQAGDNFIAITDPGSPLVDYAQQNGFRKIFRNFPDIGGRYSALSYFGLVPAALAGINVNILIDRALRMSHACAASVPLNENPGVMLGATMAALAMRGHDKVTIITPASLSKLGMWLEQLLAESTGKEGKGLLPVVGEPLSIPPRYGNDRLFIYIRYKYEVDDLEDMVDELHKSGLPVITILLDDPQDLGQEFFRWEIATATAGSILGINAFNQPNVQESKDNTNRILDLVRQGKQISSGEPSLVDGSIKVFSKDMARNLTESLTEFLAQASNGDYIALMAYLPESPENDRALQMFRKNLHDFTGLATTSGYGPRFLHSTGQYHKGGPNNGLFIQLTADHQYDLQVPGETYTFGTLLDAQALGDLQSLRKHGRQVMRVHLGEDVYWGLWVLSEVIEAARHAVKVI